MSNKSTFLLLTLLLFSIDSGSQTLNNKNNFYNSTYGGIGLIETPNARFSPDGEFVFGISTEDPFNRLYGKVQFFPWMEAVLRYTEGKHRPYNDGSLQTWKDKGFDLKFRLTEEKEFSPQIAMGFNDFGGTGAFSSEYIVASKQFNNVDYTIGLGWGRLDGMKHFTNPLTWISDERSVRGAMTGRGGLVSLKRLFSGGTASIFGGLEYYTPIDNLSIKVEYDSSEYQYIGYKKDFFADEFSERFNLDSRINYALNYSYKVSERDFVDFALGYVRGNTIFANIAVRSNLNFSNQPKIIMGAETLRITKLEPYQELNVEWKKYLTDTIIWEMGNHGLVTHNIIFNESELIAEISQGRFQNTSKMFDLAARVLSNNSPKDIKKVTVINIDNGIETIRASIDRKTLTEEVLKGSLNEKFLEFNNRNQLSSESIKIQNDYLYPNFYWEIKPHMLGTLQHQEKFYFWQLEALIHTEYSIKKGLYLTTDIGINLSNNYEGYTYHVPDGELYHVRQDRRLYLTEGESGIRRMALDYLVDLSPNIKAKLSAGYLEWMYGGLGGEVLYLPDNKRWGIGIEAYWVKQREFNQRFSFQDYETVTGFINYYQDIPFYDMRFKLSLGKFLAKDTGAHFDLSRRFKTGARVGGIVALTNCDSDCVGEGSFNKWIYFELPMDIFYTQSSTRSKAGYAWSPLTKDAGTKVEPGGLYNLMINATDEVDILRQPSWSLKKIFAGFSTEPKTRT